MTFKIDGKNIIFSNIHFDTFIINYKTVTYLCIHIAIYYSATSYNLFNTNSKRKIFKI